MRDLHSGLGKNQMATLTVVCPNCKNKNIPGRMHCLGCGHDLATLQPTQEELRLAELGDARRVPAPANPALAEQVFAWFKAYCGVTFMLYLLIVLMLVNAAMNSPSYPGAFNGVGPHPAMQVFADMERERTQQAWNSVTMVLMIVIPIMLLTAIAVFNKPTPSAWGTGVVLLCLGLGGCSLPFAVILLIHWFKPEVQRYFGREVA